MTISSGLYTYVTRRLLLTFKVIFSTEEAFSTHAVWAIQMYNLLALNSAPITTLQVVP